MKVLVIGQGGREHALVRVLNQSPSVDQVHVVPGSDGMASEAVCHSLELNSDAFFDFVFKGKFNLIVIGPEQPLADGLSDRLRAKGLNVFGPSRRAAQLEASKVFSKEFMLECRVPTAKFAVVDSVSSTLEASQGFAPPYVLKADGLCAGKGVVICQTLEELKQTATDFFENKTLGDAAKRALLEEFQAGWELSCLVVTNGKDYQFLPFTQDHKRLKDGDEGPNTGGMGVVGPVTIDSELLSDIKNRILDPVMAGLIRSKMDYRGVLYVGLMVTTTGPKVIEFNVRFGDPEAQVILPLLKGDWADVFSQIAQGSMLGLLWKPLHVCCVVLASPGYPQAPQKGITIEGDVRAETSSSYFLHAGTFETDDQWKTGGGRVLNAIGVGSSLKEAIRLAYAQTEKVRWNGLQMRKDIGRKIADHVKVENSDNGN